MAISEALIAEAVEEHIENGFVDYKTYQATHPNTSIATAQAHGSEFVGKCGIDKKAIAVLNADKKLNLKSITTSLIGEVEATKSILYKGREYSFPDHATRLNAKRTILLDMYGVGRRDNTGDVYNDNRAVLINVDIKQLAGITSELRQLTTQANNIITKLDKNKDI